MASIRNIKEAQAALFPFVPLVSQLTGKDTTLVRIKPLMKLLGNPEDRLRIVHIAGTSGKTSTAYYMSALLAGAGKKVGLTVSPHVDSITERVQINGQPISDEIFCEELAEFLGIVKHAEQQPTYFELLYAFALWVFDRQAVDYAVVETGMGGLYDATNVATRPDKVCVLTDIGYDHTHILGKRLEEIATQKIGIVHRGNVAFTYPQAQEIMEVYQEWAAEHSAALNTVNEVPETNNSKMPDYQYRNWNLAKEVYQYLKERDGLQSLTSQVLSETQQIRIPARMDIKHIKGKTLIMDGAHNAQKMTAFATSFRQLYPDVKPAIIIGLKRGKEYQDLIPLLKPIAARVITTTFKTTQDLPVRSMDPLILAQAFKEAGIEAVSIPDQAEAIQDLLNGPEKIGIITGSFYLLSQIRNNGLLDD